MRFNGSHNQPPRSSIIRFERGVKPDFDSSTYIFGLSRLSIARENKVLEVYGVTI